MLGRKVHLGLTAACRALFLGHERKEQGPQGAPWYGISKLVLYADR